MEPKKKMAPERRFSFLVAKERCPATALASHTRTLCTHAHTALVCTSSRVNRLLILCLCLSLFFSYLSPSQSPSLRTVYPIRRCEYRYHSSLAFFPRALKAYMIYIHRSPPPAARAACNRQGGGGGAHDPYKCLCMCVFRRGCKDRC